MEPLDVDPPDPETLQTRIRELEAEVARRDQVATTARSRREAAARFAGDLAVGAVAGSDIKQRARDFWSAWKLNGSSSQTNSLPEEEARELAVSILARLTRVRLAYLLAAAVPSVFILAQTILLYQQNARFDRQNNLIAFEQTSTLRSLLFLPPYDSLGRPVSDYLTIPDSLLYSDSLYRWPQPNQSSVDQVFAFGRGEPKIAFSALLPLVRDDAPPVAIGALTILGRLRAAGLSNDKVMASRGHFAEADLSGLNLRLASLPGSDFRGADLTGSDLTGAILRGSRLDGADLSESVLEHSDLSRTNLIGVTAQNVSFFDSDLYEARLDSADLAGASFKGAWLLANSFAGSNLIYADFSEGSLSYTNFEGAELNGADFSGANLRGANFRNASLRSANLSGASVAGADLSGTNLSSVDLDGISDLREAESVEGAFIIRVFDYVDDEFRANSDEIIEWALANGATLDRPPSDSLCCPPPKDPGDPPMPRPRRNPPRQ